MIGLFFLNSKAKYSADLVDQLWKFLIPFQQVLVILQALQTHPVCQAWKVHLNALDVVDGMVKSKNLEIAFIISSFW